jgi:hypothetical protein
MKASPLTNYRISKLSNIPQPTLSRFARGKAGMTLPTLDRLAAVLRLRVVVEPDTQQEK